jgi:phenylalanyl-tRNA synthetase beta chain
LFDVYRPKAAKGTPEAAAEQDRSLAVRLTLNSDEATLTDEQIDTAVHAVVQSLVAQLGARQRA